MIIDTIASFMIQKFQLPLDHQSNANLLIVIDHMNFDAKTDVCGHTFAVMTIS